MLVVSGVELLLRLGARGLGSSRLRPLGLRTDVAISRDSSLVTRPISIPASCCCAEPSVYLMVTDAVPP